MKEFRNILVLVIISVLIISSAIPTNAAASQNKELISYEQAQEAASKHISVQLLDEQIKNAQARLDYAIRKAGITDDVWQTDEKRAEIKKIKEFDPVQRRNALEVLKLQKAEKVTALKLDITKAYFTYLFTLEQQKNQSESIERLSKKLQIIKAQVKAGKVNSSVSDETEVALRTAEQQKDLFDRDLTNVSMNLNSLLGRALDDKIELVSEEVPFYESNIDIKNLISTRIANSSKILQSHNAEVEAKIQYDIVNFSSTQFIPDGLEDASDKLQQANYDYKQILVEEEHNVLNEYNDLLNLRDDIKIKELKANYSEKKMKIAKVQYDKGFIDIIVYNNSIGDYEDARIGYKKALLDYFIAAEALKN